MSFSKSDLSDKADKQAPFPVHSTLGGFSSTSGTVCKKKMTWISPILPGLFTRYTARGLTVCKWGIDKASVHSQKLSHSQNMAAVFNAHGESTLPHKPHELGDDSFISFLPEGGCREPPDRKIHRYDPPYLVDHR